MSLILEKIRARQRMESGEPLLADHDLPLLAAGVSPPMVTDWETLIVEGYPPCLILGAERRLIGRR